MRNSTGSRHAQRGAGLIEVLVAVLVLSFGMLGLAGLQMSALKNNQSSLERGVAVTMTHSIVDAMRADRTTAVNTNNYDLTLTATPPTGATFAAVSLQNWRNGLKAGLGDDATGSVDCTTAATGTTCTIVVRWSDARVTGVATATQSITTDVVL